MMLTGRWSNIQVLQTAINVDGECKFLEIPYQTNKITKTFYEIFERRHEKTSYCMQKCTDSAPLIFSV